MAAEEMKAALREVWKTVFQLEDVNDEMDFFELGGDSLKALQMNDELQKKGS